MFFFSLIVILLFACVGSAPTLLTSLSNDTVDLLGDYSQVINFESEDEPTLTISVLEKPNWIECEGDVNFTSPFIIGEVDLLGSCENVIVDGDFAYLACQDEGLHIVDVSDIRNPVYRSTYNPLYDITDVGVKNDIAYAVGGEFVYIIDVSDKDAPELISTFDTECFSLDRIHVHSSYDVMYVLDTGSCNYGMKTVNITDPSNAQMTDEQQTNYEDIYIGVSEELGILSHTDNDGNQYFYDITPDPFVPEYTIGDDYFTYTTCMQFIESRMLMVTTEYDSSPEQLIKFRDLSTYPGSLPPVLKSFELGTVDISDMPYRVAFSSDFNVAFITFQTKGLIVLNITDLDDIQYLSNRYAINDDEDVKGLFVVDDVLFLGTDEGLRIVSFGMADPTISLWGTASRDLCDVVGEESEIRIRASDSTGDLDISFFVTIENNNYHFDTSDCSQCDPMTEWSGEDCDECDFEMFTETCDGCVHENADLSEGCLSCEEDWYSAPECNVTTCNDVFSNQTDVVCQGRGSCDGFDTCNCDDETFPNVDIDSEFCDCLEGFLGEDCDESGFEDASNNSRFFSFFLVVFVAFVINL